MINEPLENPTAPDAPPGALTDLSPEACPQLPLARSFTLAGYGRVRDGDLVDQDELVADAHGMVLPDGRVVTYSDTHGGQESSLRLWPSLGEAADYWGSCVLMTTP